ncbi:Alpha/Beta hydrolase protein [Cyathus striatus]|nr:Alpha/Beta hydrolase protein [Cyathus striatus]
MLPKSSTGWIVLALLTYISTVCAESAPSSFPHSYPGKPSGDFSPAWQNYFEVNTTQLPNVTFNLGRNFAGNVGVGREGHPNDTLFFWAFEKNNGSLTNANSTDPWGIWLNGGPGSSSMLGFFFENGPIRMNSDLSLSPHNQSWHNVADYFWIDQPVGVGFSTADSNGYVADEDQMGRDFMGFLANLVKVFPSLAHRPLHLTGESYAGTYIPYILKAYFQTETPPVKLVKIAIGDGTIGDSVVFGEVPALNIIETYPQLIGYDQEVYKYFQEQSHLCGYDVNLTYPENGTIPTIPLQLPARFQDSGFSDRRGRNSFMMQLKDRLQTKKLSASNVEKRNNIFTARDLTSRANGTIDSWYGCLLYEELLDYTTNFTFPWSTYIHFSLIRTLTLLILDNRTRSALHAPTSKDWIDSISFTFGSLKVTCRPMEFLSELASNATKQNVGIVIYSGNDDSLVAHLGSEFVIQNTTFGGIQGFTRKPSTPWTDDSGQFAGVVHQERNWTYVLFKGAGHLVPSNVPDAAFTFAREFVFGNNATGLVTNSSGQVTVTGGEDSSLVDDVLPGSDEVFYGSEGDTSTFLFPSATTEAWNSFIHTALNADSTASSGNTSSASNDALFTYSHSKGWMISAVISCIILAITL